MNRQITGTGTPFAVWQSAPEWAALPATGLAELVPARLIVVAPHPDDEVLSAGGLIRLAVDAGHEVLIVAVTDGGASHPGSTRWPAAQLPAIRRAESERAVSLLGTPDVRWLRLGLDDGAVHEAELSPHLAANVQAHDVLISPWDWDGHPDHEAVARATATVARETGATHLQAPIWGWHWANPARFPWSRATAVLLDHGVQEAKERAVSAFVSQLEVDPSTGAEPILPDWALARSVHDREVFLR